ncbi:FUSC family protein [Micromonospora robiginosa]|uniref:FUSC family protein n=1 Tax=Micromonospora robiginosa TaxID=2749844 RepID=A0A7L6B4Y4_9ACTN|nr:FUSC family protein [Micromonospora ferruginea]QLQ36640.2 FUSC family protein [Micromonospora ferruginea]
MLSTAREEGGAFGRDRRRQLELIVVIAVQAGLAAGLAALLAARLGPGAHVFAPAAAVGTIATAIGQRVRRTVELLAGVGVGIVVSDVLRYFLGTGVVQTGLVVTVAIAVALLVAGRGGALVGQAGGTAVLIATLAPADQNLEVPRIVDALIGGLSGLLVVAVLLPVNPLRVLDNSARPVISGLTRQLDAIAEAQTRRDAEAAKRALQALRDLGPDVGRLTDALSGAQEVVTIAPARWRRRQHFHRYAGALGHLEQVILYTRSVARSSVSALEHDEPIPPALPAALSRLAAALRELHQACRDEQDFGRTDHLVLESAECLGRAWGQGVRSIGESMINDVRTAGSEVLRAAGHPTAESNDLVRRATTAGEVQTRPPARAQRYLPVSRQGRRARLRPPARRRAPTDHHPR